MNTGTPGNHSQDGRTGSLPFLILCAVVIVLVIYLCLNLLESGDGNGPAPDASPLTTDKVWEVTGLSNEADPDDPTEVLEGDDPLSREALARDSRNRQKITTEGDQCFCLIGKLALESGDPLPPDLLVSAYWQRPPFSFQGLTVQERNRLRGPAYRFQHDIDKAREIPGTLADPSGSFLLEGVPDSNLYLRVLHPYFSVQSEAPLKPIPLQAIEEDKTSREKVYILEERGVVEGKVLDPEGNGVASIDVQLAEMINPFFMFSQTKGRHSPFTLATDAEGCFRFEQVPVNKPLALKVSGKGHPPTRRHSIFARPGDAVALEVKLDAPASIGGLVIDAAKNPVKDVHLKLLKSSADIKDLENAVDLNEYTGDEGEFVFNDLAAGSYMVLIMEPGYLRKSVKGLEVNAGQQIDDLELVLLPGLVISGRVVDQNNQPVPGAKIKATKTFSLFSIGDAIFDQMMPTSGEADEKGLFRLAGLDENEYDLEFTAAGHAPVTQEEVVAGTEGLTVILEKGSLIAGIVISAATGEPVKNYTILRDQEEGGFQSIMDPYGFKNKITSTVNHEKGKFSLSSLSAGTYTLTFKAESLGRQKLTYELKTGEEIRGVIVALPPESSISGRALDAVTMEPIAGATLSKKAGIEGMIETVQGGDMVSSDEDGFFRLGGLDAGSIKLVVSHPRYKETRLETITLMEGESLEGLQILLSRGATVKGHVWLHNNTSMPGENIMVTDNLGKSMRADVTDEDGYYEIGGLNKGSYNVTKMPKTFDMNTDDFIGAMMSDMQSQVIQVEEDEVKVCDFIIDADTKAGTAVNGLVREYGKPVPSVMLQLYADGNKEKSTIPIIKTTDQEGRYLFTGVKPGRYTLLAMKTGSITVGSYTGSKYKITIPNRSEMTYDIDLPTGAVSGRVRDRDTLAPLQSVRIVLLTSEEQDPDDVLAELMQNRVSEVYTDEEGRFAIANLQPGEYILRAGGTNAMGMDSGGYAQKAFEELKISKGQHRDDFEIKLEKAGILEGRVTSAAGPVVGAMVYMKGPGQKAFDTFTECVTDSAGQFVYPGLNPGACAIRVRSTGLGEKIVSDLWIEKGQTVFVEVSF